MTAPGNPEPVTQSGALDQFAAAMVKVQQQVKGAVKSSTNPFFKSSYADLGSVWDACREALTANGFSVIQFPGFAEGAPATVQVTTILLHASGQWMQGTAGAPLAKPDAQSVGSAISYLRRYALAAVAGVVQEDDDGESAVERGKQKGKAGGGPSTPKQGTGSVPKEPVSAPPPAQPLDEFPKQLAPEADPFSPGEKVWPFGAHKGRKLSDFSSEELLTTRKWIEKTGRCVDFVDAIESVLAGRDGL